MLEASQQRNPHLALPLHNEAQDWQDHRRNRRNCGARLKILIAGSTFPDAELDGSRPRFVYDLAEALSHYGDVLVLAPHHPGAARRERMGSVDVIRFPYWWPQRYQCLTPNIRQQLRGSLLAKAQVLPFFLAASWSLRRLVRRHSVDVVNAHWLVPLGLVAAFAKRHVEPRYRLVLHVHAGDAYMLARVPGGRWIARYVLARSDHVLVAGSHVRDTLDRLIGRASQATIQPMGVDVAAFRSARVPGRQMQETISQLLVRFRDGFIVFVGRFVEKKGVPFLLRALPIVLREYPEIGLVLIGSGPDEQSLRDEVGSLGLEHHVQFLGRRSHEDVAVLLQESRVAAVPSIIDAYGETEGMPTVVLEALAAGGRVVGTAVDGIPDVLEHEVNGWLCREKDPESLAAQLLSALADAGHSRVMKNARATAERFDWAAVAQRYQAKLQE